MSDLEHLSSKYISGYKALRYHDSKLTHYGILQVSFGTSDRRDSLSRPHTHRWDNVVVSPAFFLHLLKSSFFVSLVSFPCNMSLLFGVTSCVPCGNLEEMISICWAYIPSLCRLVNAINIPLSVETVCVFTAPVFSAFAAWATYLLTKVRHLPLSSILEVFLCFPKCFKIFPREVYQVYSQLFSKLSRWLWSYCQSCWQQGAGKLIFMEFPPKD